VPALVILPCALTRKALPPVVVVLELLLEDELEDVLLDEELDELLDDVLELDELVMPLLDEELELLLDELVELVEPVVEVVELDELEEPPLELPLIEPAEAVKVTRSSRAPSSRRLMRSVCVPAARLLNAGRFSVPKPVFVVLFCAIQAPPSIL
jgi:hypothetical protein